MEGMTKIIALTEITLYCVENALQRGELERAKEGLALLRSFMSKVGNILEGAEGGTTMKDNIITMFQEVVTMYQGGSNHAH